MWASLPKGKTAVVQEVPEEMDRRDPSRSLTRLALTDGERALQIRVDRKLYVTPILDLMHLLEKLWKAAYVFYAQGSLEAGQLADFAEQDSQGFARASPNADFFDSLGTLFCSTAQRNASVVSNK